MKLSQIMLKDILRRKRRVLYAAVGVMVGVMIVNAISTIALAGEKQIYDQLEKYGPNLTVIPAISNLDMQLGNLSLGTLSVGENYIHEKNLPAIRQIADNEIRKALEISDDTDLATLAPKLFIQADINGTSIMVVGVNPREETGIKTWWRIQEGEYFEGGDQALVGGLASEMLGLHVGEKIPLNGNYVTVAGILENSGSNDDYQVFVPIQTLQTAYGKEGLVSSVDIRALCTGCPVEVIADEINRSIPGVRAIAVKQVAAAEMGMMERVNRFMLALAAITLVIALFGVINTMIASVNERTRDIGIMRAVGASRGQIIRLFVYEAVIIGIIGGIFGYLAGTALAFLAGPMIFEGVEIAYVPQYFPISLALSTVVAVLAAMYPAFRATRIRIVDSFRSL